MSLHADALAMVTGFGSVLVQTGSVETRGLWDEADVAVPTLGGMSALETHRALWLATAEVPDLSAEDTITVGAVEDDSTTSSYRVLDLQRTADGLLVRVMVAA